LLVRKELKDFDYVLVSSTHNHEGPDTLGLWGPNPFTSGIDPQYLKHVEEQIVKAVRAADQAATRADVSLGTAQAPELLHDGREPYIMHDELVAMSFRASRRPRAAARGLAGIVVQWNCHPETLDSKNLEISADFVGATVDYLRKRYDCPVVYLTGTVGGLMTSLYVDVKDDQGKPLADGTFEKTERYGRLVGELADRALAAAQPIQLTPLEIHHRQVFVPMDNKAYLLGRQLGVLQREAFLWAGNPDQPELAPPRPFPREERGRGEGGDAKEFKKRLCLQTEVAWLQLGQLSVAAI